KLYPAQGPKRGEAMKWIAWTNVTLGDAVSRWVRNTTEWFPVEQHNEKAAEAAKKDLENCLRILDESLGPKEFLCGDFTLADVHVNSFVDWLRHMQLDMAPYSRVNAWGQRCTARPAYKRVMAADAKR